MSWDIEANGPYFPDKYSAIQYGFALLDPSLLNLNDPASLKNAVIELKSWAVAIPPGEESDPVTMKEFWNLPELRPKYDALVKDGRPLSEVMPEIATWIESMTAKYDQVRWIAAPVSYDSQWLMRDFYRHVEDVRLPFSMTCISSAISMARTLIENIASAKYGKRILCDKKEFEAQLDKFNIGHEHSAEKDALEQGLQYCACERLDLAKCTFDVTKEDMEGDEPIVKIPHLVFSDKPRLHY
jgi:hypothetical protein